MADSEWIKTALGRYEIPLTRYAMSLLHDLEVARDIVQETFLKLCRQKRESIEPRLPGWLFHVCRNSAVDLLRKEARMQERESFESSQFATREPSPEERVERSEQLDRIEQLIQQLSENQQEVIRLRFQSGLSYRDISEVTGLSVSNVGFLIHTGLKKIRQQLDSLEHSPERLRRIR